MEDWLKCQISPLVRYRQNQNKTRFAFFLYVHVYGVQLNIDMVIYSYLILDSGFLAPLSYPRYLSHNYMHMNDFEQIFFVLNWMKHLSICVDILINMLHWFAKSWGELSCKLEMVTACYNRITHNCVEIYHCLFNFNCVFEKKSYLTVQSIVIRFIDLSGVEK